MFQLTFLNASLLLFAAATVIPLLIWLLAKRKPQRIVFSTLRFISLSKDQQKNRTKLKNIILLIIRMLIILLIVLSAARPLFQSAKIKPSKKHPPTAIVVILDTSNSMDYLVDSRTFLDKAKAAILQINGMTTNEDRIILVTSSDSFNNLYAQIFAGKIPEEIVSSIAVTYNPLSLQNMYDLAVDKLKDAQLPNREIYLLSDLQHADFPRKGELPVRCIPLADEIDYQNLSCTNASPIAQFIDRNRTHTISFDITNYGSSIRNDVLVKSVLNDTKVAERFLSIPERGKVAQTISFDVNNDGWQSGYIEVLDDRLTHDNRSYFAFPFFLHPRIAVISSQSKIPPSLASMLRIYATDQGRIDIIKPESASLSMMQDYNLVVCYDPGVLSSRLKELLNGLEQRNIGTLFGFGKSMTADWKSYLNNSFGISIGAYSDKAYSVNYVNKHHFITSIIDNKQAFKNPVMDVWTSSNTNPGNVLIASNQMPLAVAGKSKVLWLLDMESTRNPFFVDTAFPVIAFRSFQFLGNAVQEMQRYSIGDNVTANQIQVPDGNIIKPQNGSFTVTEPGVFRISQNSGVPTYIAVDPSTTESNFKAADLSKNKLFTLLPAKWQQEIFYTRMGHDLWKLLLVLAFLLIIVEIVIVKLEESKPPKIDK
ncbi:MAG: hypothetical protein CVU48_05170 [Candidatus Cloacimonetes bacterium HGW-Cloacimonetes-1]|jgi:hypothetical protein|nr:MAG: hypothetical protein CVU48_05170 [Candidatus Cloacimonetes bacterium HGW-Cloacimonetes-1]